ncbi:hypothetical protein [Streptomyces sp. NPDC008122]
MPKAFARNVDRLGTVLFKALEQLPAVRECSCGHVLAGLTTGLPGVPGD